MEHKHSYEDVKSYRRGIRENLKHMDDPEWAHFVPHLEGSIETFKKWIREAGYTIEYQPGEMPHESDMIVIPPKEEKTAPNYTAYFRLDDGTTDACDFHAKSWSEANKIAQQILNRSYREWVKIEPYTVVRNGETFWHYTYGKKPVGKRFARIVGIKEI